MTPDWTLSDLGDETVERIANEVDLRAQGLAKAGDYDGATDLSVGAEIIRDWLERRYDRATSNLNPVREMLREQIVQTIVERSHG